MRVPQPTRRPHYLADDADVAGLQTLLTLRHFELDLLVLLEVLEA